MVDSRFGENASTNFYSKCLVFVPLYNFLDYMFDDLSNNAKCQRTQLTFWILMWVGHFTIPS